jgi:hypothetical protein
MPCVIKVIIAAKENEKEKESMESNNNAFFLTCVAHSPIPRNKNRFT